MEFHIPGAADIQTADLLWNQVKDRIEDSLGEGIMPRRLRAIALHSDNDVHWVEVGQTYELEEVLIIFSSTSPLICTASHGFYKGKPFVIGPEKLVAVQEFSD